MVSVCHVAGSLQPFPRAILQLLQDILPAGWVAMERYIVVLQALRLLCWGAQPRLECIVVRIHAMLLHILLLYLGNRKLVDVIPVAKIGPRELEYGGIATDVRAF